MQQQDFEVANAGEITYTIKVHPVKSDDEEDKIEDCFIALQPKMKIKELKSFILSVTKSQPFFLKFHMNNDETLQDLIDRTVTWNS